MERASRSELIETTNTQKEQLQLYKNKLRDVVAAYKSVVKEKEALEASFSALNSASEESSRHDAAIESEKEIPNAPSALRDAEENQSLEDPLGVNSKKETKDDNSGLREQIRTLGTSLTTLSQEKNKLEASFIAERKQLRHELEEVQAKLSEERKMAVKKTEEFEKQISDLKSRIRSHQLEREREETDHALMLRELQSVLAKERSNKESLEVQLEEAQAAKPNGSNPEPAVSQVYEQQIQQLQEELRKVRDRLRSAEVKASQPSPFVVELQKEMASMKADYQVQVEKERQKASEAEARLRSQSKLNEERVSSLEAKLSELSQSVGNYERTKFQDQQAISKLRERVTQLDLENTALTKAASLSPEKSDASEDISLDTDQIVEKIMQLRKQLKRALEKSEETITLASIFVEDRNSADEESPVCKQYKEELENIKEEFERYKLRAQSVLKNKKQESGPSKETEILKSQVSDLRDKLRMANFHHREESDELQAKVDNLSKALLAQEEKFKTEFNGLKADHRKEIGELELEARKQRERTVSMLAEKDMEIQRLRALTGQIASGSGAGGYDSYFASSYRSTYSSDAGFGGGQESGFPYRPSGRSSTGAEAEGGTCDEEAEAVTKLLDLPKGVHNEAAFLHFTQERGRMEVAMTALRKQKRELESAYRDLQLSAAHREDQLKDEVHNLTERFAETERHMSREGANVEYLKNVLLQFLTSADADGKRSMLKALMTILQFSPRERQKVDIAHSKGGWWGS